MEAITVSSCRIQYPYVENMCDYGCRWRTYADTSENEDTWCGVLWHLLMSNKIQPGEHSMGGGTDGAPYIAT